MASNDENVIHVDGAPDPLRDIETIETELLLADLESVQKQIEKVRKLAKSNNQEAKALLALFEALAQHLNEGLPARSFTPSEKHEEYEAATAQLLTSKPTLYVANIDESQLEALNSGETPASILSIQEHNGIQ